MDALIKFISEGSQLPEEKVKTVLRLQRMYYLEHIRRYIGEDQVEIPLCIDNLSIMKLDLDNLDTSIELSSDFKNEIRKVLNGGEDYLKLKLDKRFTKKSNTYLSSVMDGDYDG